MRRYDFLSGLFLMILSAVTCMMAYRLGLGDIHNPGPGLIPIGVAALLFLMSIGLSSEVYLKQSKDTKKKKFLRELSGKEWCWSCVPFSDTGLPSIPSVFNICTFLLMILLLGVVGHQKWWLTLVISLFTVLCTYLIFVVWLECPFPKGPFGIG